MKTNQTYSTSSEQIAMALTELPVPPVKTVSVTPENAKLILEKWKYHGQRTLRPLEVARYARLMELGRWGVHEIRVCNIDGKKYLTDGQHRLSAVVMSGITCTFDLKEVPCSNEYEVALDYNSNGGGVPRTQADELRATGIEERLEINRNHYPCYVAAIKIINTEFSAASNKYLNFKDTKDIERGMLEHEKLYTLFLDAVAGAHSPLSRILKWAGIVSVGIITFKTNREKADEFWRALAAGDSEFQSVMDFERQLLPFANGKRPSQVHVARMVAFYWKRFNEKPYTKPNKRQFQGVDEPIYIFGSDVYTGRQKLDSAQLNTKAEQVH